MVFLIDPKILSVKPCKTLVEPCVTYCTTNCKGVAYPMYGIDPWEEQ